jgi:ubiquinone/menaquinone biosynthesis C-methylase UbiE
MIQLEASHDEVQQKYANLAPDYRKRSWVNENVFGVKRLRKSLINCSYGNVLEVACGTGENFRYLPQSATLTAVDLSPAMIKQAQQEAQKLGMAVQFERMKAEDLKFADASFDTVISTMSTCTFNDPVAALHEMQRVCSPDGKILLIEHGRSRWAWLAHYQDRHAHDHFQEAGCRWNQDPLALIKEAGLKVVHSRRHFLGIFHTIETRPQ